MATVGKAKITNATFYRKWNKKLKCYVYHIKATLNGQKFMAMRPVDEKRDRYKEIIMIFEVLNYEWNWRQSDCFKFLDLIDKRIAKNGDYEAYEKYLSEPRNSFFGEPGEGDAVSDSIITAGEEGVIIEDLGYGEPIGIRD